MRAIQRTSWQNRKLRRQVSHALSAWNAMANTHKTPLATTSTFCRINLSPAAASTPSPVQRRFALPARSDASANKRAIFRAEIDYPQIPCQVGEPAWRPQVRLPSHFSRALSETAGTICAQPHCPCAKRAWPDSRNTQCHRCGFEARQTAYRACALFPLAFAVNLTSSGSREPAKQASASTAEWADGFRGE